MDTIAQLPIPIIILVASTSLLTSFTIALNKFAIDKNENCEKIPLMYISEFLMSTLTGLLFGVFALSATTSIVFQIMSAAVGSCLGKNTLDILSKIVLNFIKVKYGGDIEEENIEEQEEDEIIEQEKKEKE